MGQVIHCSFFVLFYFFCLNLTSFTIQDANTMKVENTVKFNLENYFFEMGQHKNRNVIWIGFLYNEELLRQLKSVAKVSWSQSRKKWYVVQNSYFINLFGLQHN